MRVAGASVSDLFFYKKSKLKKSKKKNSKFEICFLWGAGGLRRARVGGHNNECTSYGPDKLNL